MRSSVVVDSCGQVIIYNSYGFHRCRRSPLNSAHACIAEAWLRTSFRLPGFFLLELCKGQIHVRNINN